MHRTLRGRSPLAQRAGAKRGMEPALLPVRTPNAYFTEHDMGIVIPFPTRPVVDEQLAIRLWELVMAGEIGSAEYRRIDAEINRRRGMQARHPLRAAGPVRPLR
jgi:hypothetical protein